VSFVGVARDGDGAWGVERETGERMTWDLAGDVVARVWIDGGARRRAGSGAFARRWR